MAREGDLINRVRRRVRRKLRSFSGRAGSGRVRRQAETPGLRVGIGDDAAVLRPAPDTEWVVTTDAFLENVHFLRKAHRPKVVGYKALARATSDIAAMGARPRYFFLTLGLPHALTAAWFDGFLDGMARAARRFGLTLAGGDTTEYPTVVVSLTVMGEIEAGKAVLRSGARPGDLICVSGRLGEAQLGLELVLRGLDKERRWAHVLKKHLYPEPRLALGKWLVDNRFASSMIDTSDGLSTDLGRICQASGVGARVWTEKVPGVQLPPELHKKGFDSLRMALHGGEDYELLFTVPRKRAAQLFGSDALLTTEAGVVRKLGRELGGVSISVIGETTRPVIGKITISVIGEIARTKTVQLVDSQGRASRLRPEGWDPFRKR
jgi:thiamine-monophosphate kinase